MVTGGAEDIGNHMATALARAGHKLVVLDNLVVKRDSRSILEFLAEFSRVVLGSFKSPPLCFGTYWVAASMVVNAYNIFRATDN
jgi:NAD(P)-dependent dehydrogenase (short-subunit alcohol dehydrogenase family)